MSGFGGMGPMGRIGSVHQVSSQQQNSFSKRIGNWLTKIVSKGSSSTPTSSATGAIAGADRKGVKPLRFRVSLCLNAISAVTGQYKGLGGTKIKQSQQKILTVLGKKIKGLEDNQLKLTLVDLKTAINELGNPEAKSFNGRRAMGYPKEDLLKVINKLPEDQKDDACMLLSNELKGDFKALGIELRHPFVRTEQVGDDGYGSRQRFISKEVPYPSIFRILNTDYSNIESSLNKMPPKEATVQIKLSNSEGRKNKVPRSGGVNLHSGHQY